MRIALLILFCLISVAASAQDVIVRRNGDEIQARVLAVSDSGIDYKKWSNQDGPTYTLSRDDVFMIKYINGDKDVFGDESRPVVQKETSSPGYVAKAPASNNAELIRKYFAIFSQAKKSEPSFVQIKIIFLPANAVSLFFIIPMAQSLLIPVLVKPSAPAEPVFSSPVFYPFKAILKKVTSSVSVMQTNVSLLAALLKSPPKIYIHIPSQKMM